jgi:serine/threonine protein kinase
VQAAEAFAHEIGVLRRLRHPRVLLFLGACVEPPELLIVMELMPGGSVWDALRKPASEAEVDPPTALRWATEAVRGAAALMRAQICLTCALAP